MRRHVKLVIINGSDVTDKSMNNTLLRIYYVHKYKLVSIHHGTQQAITKTLSETKNIETE